MSCCEFCGNIIDETRNDCSGYADPSGCAEYHIEDDLVMADDGQVVKLTREEE